VDKPGLSRLPSIRRNRTDVSRDIPFRDFVKLEREDGEYDAARELARETARRRQAEAEATRHRQEDIENRQRDLELEAAEEIQLDLEAERARYRHRPPFSSVDEPVQPRRMPETLFPRRNSLGDNEFSSGNIRTYQPAPPATPRLRPINVRTTHGRTIVRQYHYPDDPPVMDRNDSSRRPSDSIRERGREIIERERTRAAADELQKAAEEGADVGVEAGPSSGRWEPVFDEVEERVSGRENYYVSEGPARQESRRRRESWRGEKDFWS
jgi:hypothetical protein